jgi:hypothetical protein
MTIRNPVLSDSAAIAELTTQLGYTTNAEAIRSRLVSISGRQDQFVVVAVLEGKIVGWLQAHASESLESGWRA